MSGQEDREALGRVLAGLAEVEWGIPADRAPRISHLRLADAALAWFAARQPAVQTVSAEQVREAAKPIHEALGGLYHGDYRYELAAESLAQALVLLGIEVRDV